MAVHRTKGAFIVWAYLWKKYVIRPFCKRRGHQGAWAIIQRRRGVPLIGSCIRCNAIAEFDIYNRRIYFD